MTTASSPSIFEVGALIDGKYRIERVLGQGGMGIVYAAQHELLAQPVALKVVLPEIAANSEVVARFMHEARAAAKIDSDHVARVMDVGRLPDGTPYMVMEFLTGRDLDEHLAKNGALSPEAVADLLLEALDGVAHAHALGIVHRDLKPANLFLAQKPGRPARVKVLDFGIAKALEGSPLAASSVTSTKSILGSPAFMAPEQLRSSKRVDARADIWSLGVIAYQLSTGRLPYDAEDVGGLFASILEDAPVPLRQVRPGLPEAFEAVVLRCLAKKPDERFQSALALASALAPFGTSTAARALETIQGLGALPVSSVSQGEAASRAVPSFHVTPEALAETHASSPSLARPTTSPSLPNLAAPLKTEGNWATPAPAAPPPPAAVSAKARPRWPIAAFAGALLFVGLAFVVGRHADAPVPERASVAQPSASEPSASPPPFPAPVVAAPPPTAVPPPTPAEPSASPAASSAPVKATKKGKSPTASPDDDLFRRH